MADIVINPAVGKIEFFSVKGDNVTNTLRLSGNTLLVTGPLSASSISTGGGGAFVTSVQPTANYLSKFTGNSTIANSLVYDNGTNVGIGTTTPSTKLEVVGTITCTTMIETSSVVAKTNVKKLTSQTAKIAKLSPVSFNYKKDNKRSLGLIAEEVAQVYPELVEYENGQPLGVNYSKLTSVLISAVNELAAELAELKKQLNK